MENRPTLKDPAEWAIIRSMYFDDSNGFQEEIDPEERLERMNSRQHNKSSR